MVLNAVLSLGISRSSSSIGVPDVGKLLGGFGIGSGPMVLAASCSHPVVEVHRSSHSMHFVQVSFFVLATRMTKSPLLGFLDVNCLPCSIMGDSTHISSTPCHSVSHRVSIGLSLFCGHHRSKSAGCSPYIPRVS